MGDVTILVRAGQLVAAHDRPAIPHGAVAVAGEIVEAIGTYDELSERYPHAREIGGDQFLLIPGLINGHGHGRGLSYFQLGTTDNTLVSWLWDARKHASVSIYDDVAFSAARLLKSGVTTTMHNHIPRNPADYGREFSESLKAYGDAGMRVLFCPGVINDNPFIYGDNDRFLASLPEELRKFLTSPSHPGSLTGENYVQVVRDLYSTYDGPMSRIGFGPLAPQWCTKELLLEVRREADHLGVPIHIHALESVFQKIYGLSSLGKTLIAFMEEMGILGRGMVLGHCVWATEADIQRLAGTGTGVTHHPSSNLRLRAGISPVFQLLLAGVRVGLGLDGNAINDNDDFIQEMKLCFLLHRFSSLEMDSAHLTARQVFQMATENNATLLGYGQELGRLEPGRRADLVLLDFEKMCHPYVDPSHDPIETLLYRGLGLHVHTVMVNGRIVVQEGRVLTLDEETIGIRLAEAASRPRTEEEKARARAMDELRAHVTDYYKDWPKKLEFAPYFLVNSRIDGMK